MKLKDFIEDWINDGSPDSELQGFIIKDDKLYVRNKAKLLFAIKEDGQIQVRFRNDTKKYLKKFFKYCGTNLILRNKLGSAYLDDTHYYEISNMFTFYVKGDMYNDFHNNNLDIFNLVANYVDYYDCEESFYQIFDKRTQYRGYFGEPSIKYAIRGRYINFNVRTYLDNYEPPSKKYIEELDVDNLKRRFKLERMFKDLDI